MENPLKEKNEKREPSSYKINFNRIDKDSDNEEIWKDTQIQDLTEENKKLKI